MDEPAGSVAQAAPSEASSSLRGGLRGAPDAATPSHGRAALLSSTLTRVRSAPVMAAQRWMAEATPPSDRPFLNLAQAVPTEPPPVALREVMAHAVAGAPDAPGLRDGIDPHLYGPVLGAPALRDEIAAQWSADYGGRIEAQDVAITAGCNQAFCVAVATFAGPGDAVMLPSPWYFNHAMWLEMAGVRIDALPCDMDAGALPSVDAARARLTPETRAIVLVTPNNPTGAEYPPALIEAFYDLAREAGVGLILDETYRDFRAREEPAHDLFTRPEWRETLAHLYSFSKTFRLTGHRVGAMIAGPDRLAEAEKFLDTVTICAPQLGQIAALEGLRGLGAWAAEQRTAILSRRGRLEAAANKLGDWRLVSSGAYFAYIAHPFEADAETVARSLISDQGLLCLPGTMFAPRREEGGDGWAERCVRVAYANVDDDAVDDAMARLGASDLGARRV